MVSPSVIMSNASLKLFCLIYPNPNHTRQPFPVTINTDETVDDLKKAIKLENAPRLDDIAAHELTLYKVSIPDDDNLLQTLSDMMLNVGDGCVTKLRATTRLSKVFPDGVEDEHVHILAQKPGTCHTPSDCFHSLRIYY